MTCERCGAELRQDDRLKCAVTVEGGRSTCPKGGPHKVQSVADQMEAWLRNMV